MSPPSFDKLNHENYFEWSIAMSAYLTRKSLWDITSGVVTRPMGSDNSKPVKAWRAKAAQARAELILFVDPSQYPHMASDDPAEIWIALRDVHQSRGFATRLSRRRLFWRPRPSSPHLALPAPRSTSWERRRSFPVTMGPTWPSEVQV